MFKVTQGYIDSPSRGVCPDCGGPLEYDENDKAKSGVFYEGTPSVHLSISVRCGCGMTGHEEYVFSKQYSVGKE